MTFDAEEAFEMLYRNCYDDLLRFFVRRLGDGETARDALADAWVVAWRRRADIPAAGESRLWLFGVARHVVANHRRTAARQSRLIGRICADREVQPPVFAVADGPVAEAFGRLRDADREVLALVAWEGLAPEELPVALGCSPAAARVRLHRARRRLRRALQEADPPLAAGPLVSFPLTEESA